MTDEACKNCGKKPSDEPMTKDIYVKGYCFSCCMKFGDEAEEEFTKLITEKCPDLLDDFANYSFKRGLKTSAIILD